jgi:polyketide synthesis cyclase
MASTITVGTFDTENIADVTKILQAFDGEVAPELPRLRRRQLFSYSDLYIEMQDWDAADEDEAYRLATTDPRCVRLSESLSPYFGEYTAPESWDGPTDRPTAARFYRWPAEDVDGVDQAYSAVIVNTQREADSPEVSRLFAESDATELPHNMGTLRRQIYLYRGVYLHVQDFTEADSKAVISATWEEADPRFLQLVDDLVQIIPPYDPAGGSLAERVYHWSAAGVRRNEVAR